MTFSTFPSHIDQVDTLRWETYEPYYADLLRRDVKENNLRQWLEDWSRLSAFLREAQGVIEIKKTLDTTDEKIEQDFLDFVSDVRPLASLADQKLKERLLAMKPAGPAVADLTITLRNMTNQADLFREENVPLQTDLAKFGSEYDKITGAMIVDWDGEQKNLSQLSVFLKDKDRAVRERAWRTIMGLWQEQRTKLDQLYSDMLLLRCQLASNAGMDNYRDFVFREYDRFAYLPDDCFVFHQAIEEIVVPAARRIYEKKSSRLGLNSLKPWDAEVDTSNETPLHPYDKQDELIQGSLNIFQQVDPALARHFAIMAEENLLDLDTRSGKALGGYCNTLPYSKRPFIFMNGVGTHDDLLTMLHEGGHAFHVFEATHLPLVWQLDPPMEFAEVASMSMELLSAPYLTKDFGGFYTQSESARSRIWHLEEIILFLPYMAVVDAFQQWVYTNPDQAADPSRRDAAWDDLWTRFMPHIDYSGFEAERVSGWHRKLHIFHVPFYYVEYGMAQIGALQVWRNAIQDQPAAVAAYRKALALGGTKTLPELFAAAGVEFRFDTEMLIDLVGLIEQTIEELEASLES